MRSAVVAANLLRRRAAANCHLEPLGGMKCVALDHGTPAPGAASAAAGHAASSLSEGRAVLKRRRPVCRSEHPMLFFKPKRYRAKIKCNHAPATCVWCDVL